MYIIAYDFVHYIDELMYWWMFVAHAYKTWPCTECMTILWNPVGSKKITCKEREPKFQSILMSIISLSTTPSREQVHLNSTPEPLGWFPACIGIINPQQHGMATTKNTSSHKHGPMCQMDPNCVQQSHVELRFFLQNISAWLERICCITTSFSLQNHAKF